MYRLCFKIFGIFTVLLRNFNAMLTSSSNLIAFTLYQSLLSLKTDKVIQIYKSQVRCIAAKCGCTYKNMLNMHRYIYTRK